MSTSNESRSKATIQNLTAELSRAEKNLSELREELEEAQKKVVNVRETAALENEEKLESLQRKMETDKARLEADNDDLRSDLSKMTLAMERSNTSFEQMKKDLIMEEKKRERDLAIRWETEVADMARM